MKNKGKSYKAPDPIGIGVEKSVFLAGSIDMGNSEDWQSKAEKNLNEKGYTTYNPRRVNWNPDWEQTKENSEFHNQVKWELRALDVADYIVFNFLPDSKSPITLMELGLHAKENIVVCCPNEFYRSGNVHIVCEEYGIPLYKDFDQLLKDL